MTLSDELRALEAMNNSGLSMIRNPLGHELGALEAMNNSGK